MSDVITVWKYGPFEIDRVVHHDGDAPVYEVLLCFDQGRWQLGSDVHSLVEAQKKIRKCAGNVKRHNNTVGVYTDDYQREHKAALNIHGGAPRPKFRAGYWGAEAALRRHEFKV